MKVFDYHSIPGSGLGVSWTGRTSAYRGRIALRIWRREWHVLW